MDSTILEYLADRQCSPQWKGFLAALADEFAAQLPENDLRALMRRIGTRFADREPLPECKTLDDVQLAMSRIWMNMDWGWVAVDEPGGYLRIRHNCAPLRSAFGQNAGKWVVAFLEGVYQRWFQSLGSGNDLGLAQVSELDEVGCVEFRLSR
ncbi:hypothetical protein GCM10023144_14980 [Pigmentiphaga soli]|uniref:Cellulose synthase n=1 Tax=Pigmentiphaga soli TaxID=1007095 RepID=A0ABP8GRM9_9BURK